MDISSFLDQIRREIDKSFLKKHGDQLYEKTGLAPEVAVLLLLLLLLFMLFFGIFPATVSDLVAYVYPFYGTLVSIESKKGRQNWLKYWVLLGLVGVMENLIHIIVYWIPFYYPLKAVFLVWAMHPKYEGASIVYDKFLKEKVKQNLEKVDSAMKEVTVENIAKVVSDVKAAEKKD